MALTHAEPEYLTIARRNVGEGETDGENNSPFIRRMWKALGLSWLLGQPWCGGVMARWMQQAGIQPPAHAYRALSWAKWGAALPGPMLGAVAVLTRKGGGHVGIVTGISANGQEVELLGGNQDNSVSLSWFVTRRVTAWRAPVGAKLPTVPIKQPGRKSGSEA